MLLLVLLGVERHASSLSIILCVLSTREYNLQDVNFVGISTERHDLRKKDPNAWQSCVHKISPFWQYAHEYARREVYDVNGMEISGDHFDCA